ncbi:sterile alpha motif domain-containing protein 9-like [Pungitius pungitius]|uniref:sterile alpha motif domain-containing protein 9-like n=1 Tax=Pungitius pungitius TaxID=134920 RepID=UPI002E1315FA
MESFFVTSSGIPLVHFFLAEKKRNNRICILLLMSELTTMEWTHQNIICFLRSNFGEHLQRNPDATNTQLFSFLALLNAYLPQSSLLMSECQQILGPPDPIDGGPPFEERMKPFNILIKISDQCCSIDPVSAQCSVQLLAEYGISRSTTVKKLIISLCGDHPKKYVLTFIKDLLTNRKVGGKRKNKFSRLIEDITDEEIFSHAVSVLKTASDKLRQNLIYPQTLARLYYIRGGKNKYNQAEKWAKTAIERAPNNSYVADTLGQVYKNRLMKEARTLEDTERMGNEALKAFEDVEKKAEGEEGQDMMEMAGTLSISKTFNNRGLFGFIQVAQIFLTKLPRQERRRYIQNLKMKIEAKFDFFERYLTFSQPDETSTEPRYFWKDIVLCYEKFTTEKAAESVSFPGLLEALNRGLFTSKGRRAGFVEAELTVSDLERIQEDLRTAYEADPDNVQAAESYVLSNIILGQEMHDSPKLTPLSELQAIINRLLETGSKTPELHLMAVLLFWPDEEPETVPDEEDEEVEPPATEDEESEDECREFDTRDEEEETSAESEQSLELLSNPDMKRYVALMEKAYMTSDAKYHRGRCLLPLFFLGKGSGLSRWIHKSRLDKIVENEVNNELAAESVESAEEKWKLFSKKWADGDVWQIPEIQDMLLPIQVELPNSPTTPQEHEEEEVLAYARAKKIKVKTNREPNSSPCPVLFYLGFTIQGPVVF